MSKRFLSAIFGMLAIFPLSAVGQDAGIPDTVRVIGDTLVIGRSMPVHVYIFNDENIETFGLGMLAKTVDGGFARFDSVVYTGRLADPSVLDFRAVRFWDVDGNSPDTLQHDCLRHTGNLLPIGNDLVFDIYLTGLSAGEMLIDSSFVKPGSPFIMIPRYETLGTKFTPRFAGTSLTVVEGSMLPLIVVADTGQKVTLGSEISYEVGGHSPAGHPVAIELVSLTDYDDDSRLPEAIPSLSGENPALFSWTPSNGDVGIWLATFKVRDTAGGETAGSATMQVVADESYMVAIAIIETTNAAQPLGLVHGNFDGDKNPELFAPGDPLQYHDSYSVYDYDGPNGLAKVFGIEDGFAKRDAELGFFNMDDHLDVVIINRANLMILHGNGNNTFDVYDNSEPTHARKIVLTDHNSDALIDLATVEYDGVCIYTGGPDSRFTSVYSFIVEDSAISINSSDFDGDGWDDLAVGTRRGLDIYLNDQAGGYVLSHTYQQTFGALDIDVTNQGSDFNNDNIFDLCLATPSVGGESSELMVYLGNGDGSFAQTRARFVKGQIFANCPGDFNNDGELDIAYINGAEKYLAIIFGDGTGLFSNELRYDIPAYDPLYLDCMDVDLDGDLDLVVSAYRLWVGSSLFLFMNQTNPTGFMRYSLDVRAGNNADLEVTSPSGARINKVKKTMASGAYYRRNLDSNDKFDVMATTSAIESGPYKIAVTPKPNLGSDETFTLEYYLDDRRYRLANNAVMSPDGFLFTVYPDGNCPIQPESGEFTQDHQPVFDWPGEGEFSFQLADDLAFSHLLDTATVAGSVHTTSVILPDDDSVVYYWRVRPITDSSFSEIFAFNIAGTPTEITEPGAESSLPSEFALRQNYPNPFNPATEISFQLPEASFVTLKVFNIMGQAVATLIEGCLPAGEHTVTFDAGQSASGIYFYRLESGNLVATRKMILLK